MSIQLSRGLFTGLLAVALLAAGCAAIGSDAGAPAATAVPVPTQLAPSAAPAATQPPAPTATSAPTATAIPAATATSAPVTAEPAPTQVPAQPTVEPIALLPASKIWVQTTNAIIVTEDNGRKLDLESLGFPPIMGRAVSAPDGSYMAYVDLQDRLTLLDLSGSARRIPEDRDIHPVGYSFAPDSRSLAFTLTDGQSWQLQVLDLATNDVRTLREGSSFPTGDGPSLTPRPLAWTADGLIVDQIVWASDAPPSDLTLIDVAGGGERVLHQGPHIQAIPTADGAKIALVTGELRIGEPPTVAIKVLDLASGGETEIAPTQQGLVRALRWSPDGALLLYALSADYSSLVRSVAAVNADGSNAQQVDFGAQGFELNVHDVAWRDAATALVLATNQMGQVELSQLPLDSFDVTGLRPLGDFGRPAEGQIPQILYVPRGA